MKRLLFVSPSAYPLGGVATWLDLVVPRLAQLGWVVRVGLASGRFHNVHEYLRRHPLESATPIPSATGTREGRVRALVRLIREYGADVVAVVNIPDAYAAVERLRAQRRASPRVVMTVHALEADLFEDLSEFREVIDGVVCTNRLASRLSCRWGGADPGRVHYAPYGVAHSDPIPVSTRVSSSQLEIVWAGRIEQPQKRVGDLVRCAEMLAASEARFRLTIVGDGPAESWLRARLAPLAARNAVRFSGRVTGEDLRRSVYPSSDVLLITSSWETGPMVAWEAMAQGVCVVSSRYVGSGLERALIDGENCLLFPVGDVERAVAAVLRMRDPTLRSHLAARGLDLVRSRYSSDASVRAWSEALAAVVQGPAAEVRTHPSPVLPRGRLDRWLGSTLAENVRELLGRRRLSPAAPGDEWPHSYGRTPADEPRFLELAASLDEDAVLGGSR